MKIKHVLLITAVLGLLFGLGFVLIPAQLVAMFGTTADKAMQHMARNFGSAMLAMAAMSWAARNTADSVARRAIILALFVFFTLCSISIILFQLTGIPNNNGWFALVLVVPLGAACGYFLFAVRGPVEN
jgi:drug/metabolite transporter (DMT)-like permease